MAAATIHGKRVCGSCATKCTTADSNCSGSGDAKSVGSGCEALPGRSDRETQSGLPETQYDERYIWDSASRLWSRALSACRPLLDLVTQGGAICVAGPGLTCTAPAVRNAMASPCPYQGIVTYFSVGRSSMTSILRKDTTVFGSCCCRAKRPLG